MDDTNLSPEEKNIDSLMPEGGPGQEAASFSAAAQRQEFLGGGTEAVNRERNKVQEIQRQFTDTLAGIHQTAFGVLEQPEDEQLRRATLNQGFMQIDNLYRQIPEKHHLDLEVTPQAYYRLGGEKFGWLRQEKTQDSTHYRLRVGRFISDNKSISPNATILNMGVLTNPQGEPRFGLQTIKQTGIGKGDTLGAGDILNARVTENPSK